MDGDNSYKGSVHRMVVNILLEADIREELPHSIKKTTRTKLRDHKLHQDTL